VQSTAWSKGLRVTADGTGVVWHVGAALLRMLADRAGLTTVYGANTRSWSVTWGFADRVRRLVGIG
jgi:hypothetical protein